MGKRACKHNLQLFMLSMYYGPFYFEGGEWMTKFELIHSCTGMCVLTEN